ncbi:MAG TPA: peptidoglycan-associated lipoprotein Pal [Thermoanaerobaculia bacterium]|nr:peptidoglycan-associated lipoprotein Pal [Thermoanaerobaculia bacterium]
MRSFSRNSTLWLAFFAAAALVFVPACKKKPPTTTEQARPPAEQPSGPETRVPPPTSPAPSTIEGDITSQSLEEINRRGYLKDAFFDYDKADLRDDARAALSADAQWLKSHPSVQFLMEGHCDERGTSEYNLALGDRRANATREYLASLGVDASRIRTVSYGKERPFCNASTEDCWQQNRRAHFLITAK